MVMVRVRVRTTVRFALLSDFVDASVEEQVGCVGVRVRVRVNVSVRVRARARVRIRVRVRVVCRAEGRRHHLACTSSTPLWC